MLNEIRNKLGGLVGELWEAEITAWGQKVKLYRDYAGGNHRAKMTREMKELLRISGSETDQFNANYCETVVQTEADRLTVAAIAGSDDIASKWSAELLQWNRFDGLQMDVHEASLRDGMTFVMVAYDNEAQQAILAHELAWDGDVGLIPVYDRTNKQMVAAVKVWHEGGYRRVNIYYPDRVEKFRVSKTGSAMEAAAAEPAVWADNQNKAVGVPIIAFRNRARAGSWQGISELASVIPLQDALNRTLVSMVMTGELTAFQIPYIIGAKPPAKLTPGMIIALGEDGVKNDQKVEIGVLEQGQLVPFISQAQFLIDQIGTVSRTPLPEFMGGEVESGEALKQREVGLLGKVKRFQVKGGNAWENVLALAAQVQAAFGTKKPPTSKRWNTTWEEATIRNNREVIDNAVKVREAVGEKEFLRLIAPVYGWDEAKIEAILAYKAIEQAQALAAMGGNQPEFGGFNLPGSAAA